MSERRGTMHTHFRNDGLRLGQGRRRLGRWPYYVAVAVIALLAIAYIDAGEEPLHPIEQQIALPSANGASE